MDAGDFLSSFWPCSRDRAGFSRTLGAALSLAAWGALSSCSEDPPETCTTNMDLVERSVAPAAEGMEQLLYRGELDEGCQRLTRDASGNVAVRIHHELPENATGQLSDVRAGERRYAFAPGKAGFLTPGQAVTHFESNLFPEWKLPWEDKPSTLSLTLQMPRGTAQEKLPTGISVELAR